KIDSQNVHQMAKLNGFKINHQKQHRKETKTEKRKTPYQTCKCYKRIHNSPNPSLQFTGDTKQ
ncbi:hypothetical protein, partial [Staphylococcus chromogenes]